MRQNEGKWVPNTHDEFCSPTPTVIGQVMPMEAADTLDLVE